MKKHVLYVGLKDKDTKRQVISKKQAKTIIAEACGDCTMSDACGVYTHNNGEQVIENTVRVEMLFKELAEVKQIAEKLKKQLNQESIGYECIESDPVLL